MSDDNEIFSQTDPDELLNRIAGNGQSSETLRGRGSAEEEGFPVDNWSYAGFWLRLIAFQYDAIFIGIVNMLIIMLFTMVGAVSMAALSGMGAGSFSGNGSSLLILLALLPFAIQILYGAAFEGSPISATPGKFLLGLAVSDTDRRSISFGSSLERNFFKNIPLIIAPIIASVLMVGAALLLPSVLVAIAVFIISILCLIPFLMAGFTYHKQAWHDKKAYTLVLKSERAFIRRVIFCVLPFILGIGFFALILIGGLSIGMLMEKAGMEGNFNTGSYSSSSSNSSSFKSGKWSKSADGSGYRQVTKGEPAKGGTDHSASSTESSVKQKAQEAFQVRGFIQAGKKKVQFKDAVVKLSGDKRKIKIMLYGSELDKIKKEEFVNDTGIAPADPVMEIQLHYSPFMKGCDSISLISYAAKVNYGGVKKSFIREMADAHSDPVPALECLRQRGQSISGTLKGKDLALVRGVRTPVKWYVVLAATIH